MSTPLQPLGDYVVATGEEAKSRTDSGIYLPEKAADKPKAAKVVAVGPKVQQVKKGDRIVYKSFSTTEIKVGKEEYILVEEKDVLATVK